MYVRIKRESVPLNSMYRSRIDELEELVKPTIKHLGFDLWGIEQHTYGRRSKICIYIESKEGINADDCAKVSNQVMLLLEVEDSTDDFDTMEVSSPGLDRILFKPSQYDDYVGEMLDVRTHLPIDGQRRFRARLDECNGAGIVFTSDNKEHSLNYEQIRMTRVIPNFNKQK